MVLLPPLMLRDIYPYSVDLFEKIVLTFREITFGRELTALHGVAV